MKSLDAEIVLGVQFLRGGKVRLTFEDAETCSAVLKDSLDLGDVPVQLFPANDRVGIVHLRDLPVEVDHDSVSAFFATYGEVLSIDHCPFEEQPTVRNGNRVNLILLTEDSRCFVKVEECSCRVWYYRQPAQCYICREIGHRSPACPLSGRCRRCHHPGHVARECAQAWGPSFSAPRSTVPPDYSVETQEEVSAPVPVTTASVTDTSPSDTTPAIATVCAAATVSKPCSTFTTTSVATTTTCSTAAATVSNPCSMFSTTSVATDSTYTVTTSTSTVPSTSVKAPLDVATKIARL